MHARLHATRPSSTARTILLSLPVLLLVGLGACASVTDTSPRSAVGQSMAQAICTAVAHLPPAEGSNELELSSGWIYAVPRECSNTAPSCKDLCLSLANSSVEGEIESTKNLSCFNSIHVYGNPPAESAGQLGLKTHIYNHCDSSFCGPNYCCCGTVGTSGAASDSR